VSARRARCVSRIASSWEAIVAQGHLRIGHGNTDDERHQAVFGRFATRALDQIRLDKMLLDEAGGRHAADARPSTSRRALRIEHPHDIFPGMIWPHPPDRWSQVSIDESRAAI